MPVATASRGVSMGGVSINANQQSRTADGGGQHSVALPVAWAGELTTRTDDDSGVVTIEDDPHVLATSDVVDIYWLVAGVWNVRYGCVAAVSGQALTVNNDGFGAVLPLVNTDVIVAKSVIVETLIKPDDLVLLAMSVEHVTAEPAAAAHLRLTEADNTAIGTRLLSATRPRIDDVLASEVTGLEGEEDVGKIVASHNSIVGAATLKVIYVQDSTP